MASTVNETEISDGEYGFENMIKRLLFLTVANFISRVVVFAVAPYMDHVPLYMDYIGMCGLKGYGFSAVLVINRVSILAILVINGVWF